MKTMEDNSIDSIVTDPPYELGFMGKSWDSTGIAFNVEVWREALRVLKPGGHLLAFSGSRTYHRMAVAIEDAGFEIRDQIMWIYGSGFPKSLNIAKAIDKASGFEGEVIGRGTSWNRPDSEDGNTARMNVSPGEYDIKELSETAKQWQGWGTALKPAHEPMVLARKPLIGTVAANVLEYGVGGLNIDATRVEGVPPSVPMGERTKSGTTGATEKRNGEMSQPSSLGRFPANVIHDGSDEVVALFGEPARFFYCAKASKRDRNEGLEGFEDKIKLTQMRSANGTGNKNFEGGFNDSIQKNTHPTVKPTDLMRYLCRLITPPNGTILDPFTGSGSTGKGAIYEGFNFIGIEKDESYVEIAKARIEFAIANRDGSEA